MERGLSGVIGVQRGGSFVLSAVLGLVLVLGAFDAEAARRLGGGMSVGKQSNNVTRREAAPAQPQQSPSAPAQNSAAGAAPASAPANAAAAPAASTAAAASAASPARRSGMMGLLGGVAAGLGLAWLASSLGLGAAFGQFMLIALLVLLAFVAFRWLTRPRPTASNRYAFQGGAGVATIPSAYYPENVGNDASARPWEQGANAGQGAAGQGVVIGSALSGSASSGWSVPAGFDVESFLKVAKSNFIHLQAAWDKADMVTLRSMMTDDMLAEISAQLAERERLSGGAPNLTEVQMLQAQLLGIEDLGGEYMASVEFSGMVREDRHSGPSPFREVWNMTKPNDGSRGWLVAGVQALQ